MKRPKLYYRFGMGKSQGYKHPTFEVMVQRFERPYASMDTLFELTGQMNTGPQHTTERQDTLRTAYGYQIDRLILDPTALDVARKFSEVGNRWRRGTDAILTTLRMLKAERVEYSSSHQRYYPRKHRNKVDAFFAAIDAGLLKDAA